MYVVLVYNVTGLPAVLLKGGEAHRAHMQSKGYSTVDEGTKEECNIIANVMIEELEKSYCLS